MLRAILLMLAVSPLIGQTAAGMLGRLTGVRWEGPPAAACTPRIPVQMDIYATVQWTHYCADTRDGVIRESFFYVFGEPARIGADGHTPRRPVSGHHRPPVCRAHPGRLDPAGGKLRRGAGRRRTGPLPSEGADRRAIRAVSY